jgi:hypothetical protein
VIRSEPLKRGDAIRVRSDHPGRLAGRMGILVAIRGDDVEVRFSARRSYTFTRGDLTKVLDAVRRVR